MRRYITGSLLLIAMFLSANTLWSQSSNPDLMLSQAERDSILKTYDRIFPIWGKRVIQRGFDLPKTWGLNVIYLYANQGLTIDNMQLGFGDNPLQKIDFIGFDDNKSIVNTVNGRFDFWLFPFINLYGLFGKGWSQTTVNPFIKIGDDRIPFTSKVNQAGIYYGFGITGAVGIKKNWLSIDMNWTWTDLELLDDPVRVWVTGIRYGRTIRLSHNKRIAVWIGAMNQTFATETYGEIYLKDALPGNVIDDINNIPNMPGWNDLPQWKKDLILELIDNINNKWDTAKIKYGMDKAAESPWNMLIGANYEFNKAWQFRLEAGVIKRYSLLANLNFRF